MKITVYTIKDCAFSRQEKEYLNTNKLSFEEKDLETNKDFLTEMLAISNNFAGTPVTRVEKDDGSIAVLKGFTKEEFDTTFGLAVSPTSDQTPAAANDTPITIPPVIEVPSTETIPPIPIPTDTTPIRPITNPTDSTNSTNSTTPPDPLKSVMDDLQSKSQVTETVAPLADQPIQPTPTDSTTPPADAPAIPDFPADGKTTV